jgi:hypothetical protein
MLFVFVAISFARTSIWSGGYSERYCNMCTRSSRMHLEFTSSPLYAFTWCIGTEVSLFTVTAVLLYFSLCVKCSPLSSC